MRCSYCGSTLHDKRTCPKTWAGSSARANLWCSYCGAQDHDKQACPKRHTGRAYREQGIRVRDWWLR